MTVKYEELLQVYHTYLSGGERKAMPPDERTGGYDDYISASWLFKCPIPNVLRHVQVKPFRPPTPREERIRQYVMEMGTRTAETLQEALYHGVEDTEVERVLIDHNMKLKGRYDVLYGGHSIIEIKTRFGQFAQPRISDLGQLYAYMHTLGVNGYLLIFKAAPDFSTDEPFDLWRAYEHQSGTFALVRQDGVEWMPERPINQETLRQEIENQHQWLDWALSHAPAIPAPGEILPPLEIADPRNHECVTWVQKPERYKRAYKGKTQREGIFLPRCEYFCHTALEGPFYAELDDEDNIIVTWSKEVSDEQDDTQDD